MTITDKLRDNLREAQDMAQPYVDQVQRTAGAAYNSMHAKIAGKSGMTRTDSASDVTVLITTR